MSPVCLNHYSNAEHLLEVLGWRKHESQQQINKAVTVFKLLKGLTCNRLFAGQGHMTKSDHVNN